VTPLSFAPHERCQRLAFEVLEHQEELVRLLRELLDLHHVWGGMPDASDSGANGQASLPGDAGPVTSFYGAFHAGTGGEHNLTIDAGGMWPQVATVELAMRAWWRRRQLRRRYVAAELGLTGSKTRFRMAAQPTLSDREFDPMGYVTRFLRALALHHALLVKAFLTHRNQFDWRQDVTTHGRDRSETCDECQYPGSRVRSCQLSASSVTIPDAPGP